MCGEFKNLRLNRRTQTEEWAECNSSSLNTDRYAALLSETRYLTHNSASAVAVVSLKPVGSNCHNFNSELSRGPSCGSAVI